MATSRTQRQPKAQTVRAPKPPKPPKAPKPMSATQRNKLATKGITAALGIPDEGEKAAIIAVLEAVHERLAADVDLRETVRQKYQEIAALGSGTHQKAGQSPTPDLGPTPIPIHAGTPEEYNPYAAFDPYKLVWRYGEHQLRAVLMRGTQRDLREAVSIVQEHEPGTAPRSKTNNADMVDYIMQHVVGPGR
jgi:hypothetical protein